VLVACAGAEDPAGADSEVKAASARKTTRIFVNFDDVELRAAPPQEEATPATDDATKDLSSTVTGRIARCSEEVVSPAARKRIVKQVEAYYADFDVELTTERPKSGDYTMVVIGCRTPTTRLVKELAEGEEMPGGIAGLDCRDANRRGVAIVFADANASALFSELGEATYGRKTTAKDFETLIAHSAAHELGHSFGLSHVDTADSIMFFVGMASAATGTAGWKAGPKFLTSDPMLEKCGFPSDVQETDPEMLKVVGFPFKNEDPHAALLHVLGPKRP
jgi:predicted Zn-dependent protease